MKFFLPSNVPVTVGRGQGTDPFVRINANGTITLSEAATVLLDVKAGDKIAISQDDDGEWYVTKNSEGFVLRGKNNSPILTMQCVFITKQILDDETKSARMMLAKEPIVYQKQKLYAILTSSKK